MEEIQEKIVHSDSVLQDRLAKAQEQKKSNILKGSTLEPTREISKKRARQMRVKDNLSYSTLEKSARCRSHQLKIA